MELLILAALGYVIWRVTTRKSSPPAPPGRPVAPPPSGRPVGSTYTYATFSTDGKEGWPPAVLKAVEGVFEIASADEPTTLGKLRTMGNRLTKLGEPIAEHVDALLETMDEEDPRYPAFEDFRSAVEDLESASDEAADAEDVVDVDLIGTAQGFVDEWQKVPNP